jgi:hypothetical protein
MPKKKSAPLKAAKANPLSAKQLTPELSARIIKAFVESGSLKQAAEAAGVELKVLYDWLEQGRKEEAGIHKALGDGLSFRGSEAEPKAAEKPPAAGVHRGRNRNAEFWGALYEALYCNVRRHLPALAEAFDREVDRLQTAHATARTRRMVWEDEDDPMVTAIRAIDITTLRGRRQLRDPYEHTPLLRAYMGFHRVMVMMHRAWRASRFPLGARLEMLEKILPPVARHFGFTRHTPPRETDDSHTLAVERIVDEDPAEAAFLLLAHYTGHTPDTVRQYVKRARRAFISQGLPWAKIIQPFPPK